MTDIVRSAEGVQFSGLPGTPPLEEALILSGPYKVADAPNAYSFTRSNTIKISNKDSTAILTKIGVPVAATNSALLRVYVEDAWNSSRATPADALIDVNAFDLDASWPVYVPDTSTVRNAVVTGTHHPTFSREDSPVTSCLRKPTRPRRS